MRKTLFFTLLLTAGAAIAQQRLTDYVDPRIGTGDHGHVFVGANVPQGMVNVGPTQIETGWDWCSGYHQSGDSIVGFGHLHLSGTGCSDLGDVALMPSLSVPEPTRVGLASPYRHVTETMRPGYYSVLLDRDGVRAEMTSTCRVAMHRYTYPAKQTDAKGYLTIDLEHGVGDLLRVSRLYKVDDHTLAGLRNSRGWAGWQEVFFCIEFSESFEVVGELGNISTLSFKLPSDGVLLAKVALSPTSEHTAKMNMQSELSGWDFDQTAQQALDAWEKELHRVQATFATEREASIFYTGLYHYMVAPQVWCDVNGDYKGSDGAIRYEAQFTNYTTWSLWDTYRAAHPLATLIMSDRLTDYAQSMLHIYREQEELPVWHLMSNETYCMVGCPAVPVLADMVLKGVEGIDPKEAFRAMKESLLRDNRSLHWMKSHGYVPYDRGDWEPVAKSLEYYLADWSAAQVAGLLSHSGDVRADSAYRADSIYFYDRSMGYKRLFDPELQCMRALDTSGNFRSREGFNPCHQTSDYTEGNPWQYTWLVPHDVKGLVECFPSEAAFTERLDSLFLASSELNAEANPDISGLIGQYAHGNEPSHHILYLYNYVGQPWKGARRIRQVMEELYTDQPAGLCGNEDVGQMSAWYIMSALGLYQVEPCGGLYQIGSPTVREAQLQVPGGVFTIRTHGIRRGSVPARGAIYVHHVELNGQAYPHSYLRHADIVKGGSLDVYMSTKPSRWGTDRHCGEQSGVQKWATSFHSANVDRKIASMQEQLTTISPRLWTMFRQCFPNTLETTVRYVPDAEGNPTGDDTFVVTGDIDAMWLRDSGAQVWPYLPYMQGDEPLRKLIRGVIRRQMACLCLDPYANAFNREATGSEWQSDYTDMRPELHERKYELDSQCYPIRLAHEYWRLTGDVTIFDERWIEAMSRVLATMREQQCRNGLRTSYNFQRTTHAMHDTRSNWGYGHPARPVGLIASAFRPSDDCTLLPFLVPSNFMAVDVLRKAAVILGEVNHRQDLADECMELAAEVEQALNQYAVVDHPDYGRVYAYEVDGRGSYILMDDANVPSLLSLPYITSMPVDDPVYQNTRRMIWGEQNPYFFEGKAGRGIGSPHTGYDWIWPMSLIMHALTSTDPAEQQADLQQLLATDAGTGFMHEAFKSDDASRFTRSWFAWANTLFGEMVLKIVE